MPIEIVRGSLEERIIRFLLEVYPARLDDLEADLRVPSGRVLRVLRALATRGIVELEDLPDRTFIRLLRRDFTFVGVSATQRKRYRHRGGAPPEPEEYEGPMFG